MKYRGFTYNLDKALALVRQNNFGDASKLLKNTTDSDYIDRLIEFEMKDREYWDEQFKLDPVHYNFMAQFFARFWIKYRS